MFYDMFLDEVLYLNKEESVFFKPSVFDGLVKYSKKEIDFFKNGKVNVLKKEKDIYDFIKFSRNVFSNNSKLYYGKINKEVSKRIKSFTGLDISMYNLSLQIHNIKHIYKRHGNPILELAKSQMVVQDSDFVYIPYIICNFDDLYISEFYTNYKNIALVFEKEIDSVVYNVVAYISSRKRNLEIKTFFKKKKRTLATVW